MTLRPARLEFFLVATFFLVWSVFSGIRLAPLQQYEPPDRVLILYTIGFIVCPALLGVFFLLLLHPKAAYLKLEEKGFTLCTFFRSTSFKWTSVSSFQVKRVLFLEQVTFSTDPSCHRLFRARCFPYNYGKKPEQLAALLNEWRDNAIGRADAQRDS